MTVDHANVIASANTTNTDALAPDSSYRRDERRPRRAGHRPRGREGDADRVRPGFRQRQRGQHAHGLDQDRDMGRHERARRLRAELAHRLPGRQLPEQQQHGGDLAGLHGAQQHHLHGDEHQAPQHAGERRLLPHRGVADGGRLDATIDTRSGDSAGLAFAVARPTFSTGSATQAIIRFRLTSDGATTADGVHIDDIEVNCTPVATATSSEAGRRSPRR